MAETEKLTPLVNGEGIESSFSGLFGCFGWGFRGGVPSAGVGTDSEGKNAVPVCLFSSKTLLSGFNFVDVRGAPKCNTVGALDLVGILVLIGTLESVSILVLIGAFPEASSALPPCPSLFAAVSFGFCLGDPDEMLRPFSASKDFVIFCPKRCRT